MIPADCPQDIAAMDHPRFKVAINLSHHDMDHSAAPHVQSMGTGIILRAKELL
jgi:hypothetical protein